MKILHFYQFCLLLLSISHVITTETDDEPCDENFPWSDLRLPTTVFPLLYEIQAYPNLNDFILSGWVKITINVSETTDLIVFNQNNQNLTLNTVELRDGSQFDYRRSISYSKFTTCKRLAQAAVELDQPVAPGDVLILEIEFRSFIEKDYEGAYRTDYLAPDGSVITNIVTQLESSYAREVFPCFDEPEFKANFEFSLIREPQYTAFANMPLLHTDNYTDGLLIDIFDTTVKMSSYLFAFTVGTYAQIFNETTSGINVSVIAVPDQIEYGSFALDIGIRALEFFEEYFGISYPLPKMDMVSVPDFAMGAMENWGLMTFRDTELLTNKGTALSSKQRSASTIVHEVAHQWFGNLVTMKWWNDLWLNEGFATFMQYFALDKITKEWGWNYFETHFYTETVSSALNIDGFSSSHPIETGAETPDEIETVFDTISYQKGASIINMFHSIAGDEAFRDGIHEYLETFSYSNAEGADLWRILEKRITNLGGNSLSDVATVWIKQTGYPLIKISLNEDGTQVRAQQIGRFYYLKTERDQEKTATYWPVPVTYISDQTEKPQTRWLDASLEPIVINFANQPVQWVKFNDQGSGYYRLQYDNKLFQMLINKLMTDASIFTVIDRTNIVVDALSLVSAGMLEIGQVMELLEYARITEERDPTVLGAVYGSLNSFAFHVYQTDWLPKMHEYIRSHVEPLYKELVGETPEENLKKLQGLIISAACGAELQDCLQTSQQLFDSWIQNSSLKISNEALVLSLGIKKANSTVWDVIFERYQESNMPTEKTMLLSVLGSSQDPWILQRFLSMTLNPELIKGSTMNSVISSVSSNPAGTLLAWRFFRMHWDEINNLVGGTSMLGNVIASVISSFDTEFDYNEVQSFFDDKDLEQNQNTYDSALKNIELNIQWKNENLEPLRKWIENWLSINSPSVV